jgi:glycolate oxidase iron-sulfur subunit
MDPWFSEVHEATIGLLTSAGFEVVVPAAQGCCGALAAHDGHAAAASRMAEVNRVAFGGCDIVVSNAAGCSAHLKDLRSTVGPGPEVLDVTELVARCLSDGLLPTMGVDRGEVAVQDPCHLRHAQRVTEQPRSILRAAGYRPREIDPDGLCCGAAGVYSVLRPETSHRLGIQKADQVQASGAMIVASANPGCEMQLRSHLSTSIKVAHPVELYWEAFLAERVAR